MSQVVRRPKLLFILALVFVLGGLALTLAPSSTSAATLPVRHQINYYQGGMLCGYERFFCDGSYAYSGSLMGTQVHYWYTCEEDP